MRLISPRKTAPYQTLECAPSVTSPMTVAVLAMYTPLPSLVFLPRNLSSCASICMIADYETSADSKNEIKLRGRRRSGFGQESRDDNEQDHDDQPKHTPKEITRVRGNFGCM